MHFGRVSDDRGLQLALPSAQARTLSYLRLGHAGRGLIHGAAPIWATRDWVGSFYPEGTRPSEYLRVYAQHYSSVEFNGSFYSLPSSSQVQSWLTQIGPDFRFCPKLHQDLSHKLGQPLDLNLLHRYFRFCEDLGSHLGLSFLQLPEWFSPAHLPSLMKFLDQWSRNIPLAIEFRHPDWFHQHMLLDSVINLLYRAQLATVITDTPGRRDVLHMSLTQPKLIVRFQGCFPSARDDQRIRDWMDRLVDWANAGMDEIFFFIHQARNGAIPQTVDFALRCLHERRVH